MSEKHTGYNKKKRSSKRRKKALGTVLLIAVAAAVILICFRLGEESELGSLSSGSSVSARADSDADGARTDSAAASGAESSDSSSADSETDSDSSRDARIRELLAESATEDSFWEGCPTRKVELLTPNEYSRPQEKMQTVNRVVIHYTASPGAGAEANREYFESLATTGERHASSHFIVDLDGSILQCIPISEVAYAQVHANYDSISIECCHPDESGKFNDDTFYSAADLAAFFCMRFSLDPKSQVVRHYDVTGKECPLYYVNHEDAWQDFLDAVEARYEYLTQNESASSSSASS